MQKGGLFLVFGTAIISGVSIFINKFGVSVINPYVFTGLKNVMVLVFVLSWLVMMKDWQLIKNLRPKQWLQLLGIGLIGGSVPFLLFFKGLSLASAAQAAFIHKTMFLWVILFAVIFLKEKISKNFLILALLLLLGNTLLLNFLPIGFGLGDLLILGATLCWALETVISKKALVKLPARIVVFGRMLFGSCFIILFWVFSGQFDLLASLNTAQISWVLITAVLLFGYAATWYSGLKYIKASAASAVLVLGGPVTAALSLGILQETISACQIIGITVIVASLVLLFFEQQKKNNETDINLLTSRGL